MRESTRDRIAEMALLEFRGDSYEQIGQRFSVTKRHVCRQLNTEVGKEHRQMLRTMLANNIFGERVSSLLDCRMQLPYDLIVRKVAEKCRTMR